MNFQIRNFRILGKFSIKKSPLSSGPKEENFTIKVN